MAKRETKDERRKSGRVDAKLAVELTAAMPASALQLMTESINISTGGVYCCVKSEVPVLTKVDLNIQLPKFAAHKGTQVLRCEGLVVRCEPVRSARTARGSQYDVACAFQNLDTESQALINEFVLWKTLTAGRR